MSSPITDQILAAGAQKIVNDYGAAIESRKSAFADDSELPNPKPVIKAAMIAAIQVVQDAKARELLKTNFVLLADWQEGIGPGPHDLDVADRPGETIQEQAKRISETAPAYMAILKRVTTEMQGLLAELKSLSL
jgi:hypothetical protein